MNFLLNTGEGGTDFFTSIQNVFASFTPRDAIDIFLLAIIFIFAFTVIKGRKAGALIIGITVCIAFLIVSRILELTAVYSLFNGIVESGTLVFIVIFQPEIRDALEKIGKGSIDGIMSFSDRKKKKELYYRVIDNICSAVDELSAECTGALIVVERTTRLVDIIDGGVAINADVNDLLLRNLFYNKAPLHDGAVVISEGRIAAAACFLPLTRHTDLDSSLGTRHRAALGMSESSDALIIVVSEETGKISVAHDCELDRNLTTEELKKFLLENLMKVSCNPTDSVNG